MKEFLQELGLLLYKYDTDIVVRYNQICIANYNTQIMEFFDTRVTSQDIQEVLREWED